MLDILYEQYSIKAAVESLHNQSWSVEGPIGPQQTNRKRLCRKVMSHAELNKEL